MHSCHDWLPSLLPYFAVILGFLVLLSCATDIICCNLDHRTWISYFTIMHDSHALLPSYTTILGSHALHVITCEYLVLTININSTGGI